MSDIKPPPGEALSGGLTPSPPADRPTGAVQLAPTEVVEDGSDRKRKKDERGDRDQQRDEEKRRKARKDSEKELLTWTRMSISLTTTGLGAERALAYLNATDTGRRLDPYDVLHTLALWLVAVGVGALALACVQHWRLVSSLKRGEPAPEPPVSLSLFVAVSIIAIFAVALVTVLSFRDVLKPAAGAPSPAPVAAAPAAVPPTSWSAE